MKVSQLLLTTVLLSMLTACATNFATKTPAEIAAAIEVKNSDFDRTITYIGPPAYSEKQRGIFTDNQTVRLAAGQDKETSRIAYVMYISILYSFDWRFYESVSFRDSTRVAAQSVNRTVNGCSGAGCIHTEEFMIQIDRSRLDAQNDLEFRVNSRSGTENVITLPKNYIDGFLQAIREKTGSI